MIIVYIIDYNVYNNLFIGVSVKIKFVINRKNKEIVDITCEKNKLNSNILKLFRLMIN